MAPRWVLSGWAKDGLAPVRGGIVLMKESPLLKGSAKTVLIGGGGLSAATCIFLFTTFQTQASADRAEVHAKADRARIEQQYREELREIREDLRAIRAFIETLKK